MTAPTAEFNHVAQFMQTFLALSFLMMFVSLLLSLLKGTIDAIRMQRELDDEEYFGWLDNGGKYGEKDQGPSLEEIGKTKSEVVQSDIPKPDPTATAMQPKRVVNPEDDLVDTQAKYFRFYMEIKLLFEQYLPVIMCVLVAGMMTASTEVFSLSMFFCYMFSLVLFNYLQIRTKKGTDLASKPFLQLISGIFMLALFISYFVRAEFPTA